MATGDINQVQDDVLQFMYDYLRKYPSNPWLVAEAVAQDVEQKYLHDRTDVEEAVIRLGDIGKLTHRSETHTTKSFTIGLSTIPGTKITTVRYRISDKGMQEINPSKHASNALGLYTDIHADNVVVINGHNIGTINQTSAADIANVEDLVKSLLESGMLNTEMQKQLAIDSQLLETELLSNKPRKGIVETAWATIAKAADLVGLATVATPVGEHLIKLL
jgi:hypothetical protein